MAALLAAYWQRHPAACDTPEGMQRWWLNGRADVSLTHVEDALIWMIEQGFVEQRLTGARSIFRLRAGVDCDALQALAADEPGGRRV